MATLAEEAPDYAANVDAYLKRAKKELIDHWLEHQSSDQWRSELPGLWKSEET